MDTGVPDMSLSRTHIHLLQESTALSICMHGRVEWLEGSQAFGLNDSGDRLDFDWDDGPTPMQVTLQMIGLCSMADVVLGLKERNFDKVWVEMDAERASGTPRVFTSIHLEYHVRGDVPHKLVDRIVAKSHEKYCSVSHMFNEKITITHSSVVHSNSEA